MILITSPFDIESSLDRSLWKSYRTFAVSFFAAGGAAGGGGGGALLDAELTRLWEIAEAAAAATG